VNALIDLLAESRKEILQSDRRAVESLRGHKIILDAVKMGDGVRAREAMRRHLQEIEKLLFKGKKGGGRWEVGGAGSGSGKQDGGVFKTSV
jgi:DNA-binding FadR family transcriptional regulator